MAGLREYNFIAGIETGVSPAPGAPTLPSDLITKSYADANFAKVVANTYALPASITAAGGITVSDSRRQTRFVKGNSGAVDLSANPQISAGVLGDELRLIGCSDTDTLQLDDGTGLLMNGPIVLRAGTVIDLEYNGTVWIETGRNS